jgi:succinate dehydrogenase / fumarate reductase iron-sulfur subunit
MKVQCEVYKFNPEVDAKGRFISYELEMDPSATVLDALNEIQHKYDPALAFRFACGVVRCGECAMLVNDRPYLACDKTVESVMKIEPLPNLPVVKDLVVDRRSVFDKIFRQLPAQASLKNTGAKFEALDLGTAKEEIEHNIELTKCFECCMCQSSCPVYSNKSDEFIGPLGLVWLAQMCVNPTNAPISVEKVQAALAPCLHCGACSASCPAEGDLIASALNLLEKY